MFFGYTRHIKSNSYIFIADPEKAVIDGIYLGIYNAERLIDILPKLNKLKLAKILPYLNGYGSKKIRSIINDK